MPTPIISIVLFLIASLLGALGHVVSARLAQHPAPPGED